MALNFASRVTVKSSGWFSGSVYERIVQAILYGTVVLLPLWYLPFTASPVEFNKQMLLVGAMGVALIVWLIGVVVSGTMTMRTTVMDKGIFALAGATVVATVFSPAPLQSFFGSGRFVSSSLLSILSFTVLYFLIVQVVPERGRPVRLALMFSLLTSLALGILQIFNIAILPGATTALRSLTTVGMVNALGLLSAVALPFFARRVMPGAHTISLGAGVCGVVLTVTILALVNWWVLWVVALVGMLAAIALDSVNADVLAMEAKRNGRSALVRFLVPMLVVVLGAFFLVARPAFLAVDLPTEVVPSHMLTLDTLVHTLAERPATGIGPEQFSVAFDRFSAHRLADTAQSDLRLFDGAGEAFTLVTQTGVLGLAALALIFWALVQIFQRFGVAIAESRTRGQGTAFVWETSGILAAGAGLTVGFFLYPFNLALMALWFIVLALAGVSVSERTSRMVRLEERPTVSLFASLGFMAGLVLILVVGYFFTLRYIADIRYAHAFTQTTASGVLADLDAARDLNGHSDTYFREASQATLSVARDEIAKGTSADAKKLQALIGSAIQLAQRATDIAPAESLNWDNLGKVYTALVGSVDHVEELAAESFQEASLRRPGDPSFASQTGQLWLVQAELLRRTGQPSTDALTHSAEALQHALELAPTSGTIIYNLGAVYERQGRVHEAISQLEKVAPSNASNQSLFFQLAMLYIRAGWYDDAKDALEQVLLVTPSYANARWYLALLLEREGSFDEALAQLYIIRATNSTNAALAEKILQLEEGRGASQDIVDVKPLSG